MIDPTPPAPASLHVLGVIANPIDQVTFDADDLWRCLESAAHAFDGRLTCSRLAKPTESALRDCLANRPFDAVFFAGHAECRTAIRYTSVWLESSDRRSRKLSGECFAAVLGFEPRPQIVILQACDAASFCFSEIAKCLLQEKIELVIALPVPVSQPTLSAIFSALLSEQPAMLQNIPGAELFAAPSASRQSFPKPKHSWYFPPNTNASNRAGPFIQKVSQEPDWQTLLREKEGLDMFDVFLCYNSADREAVKQVAARLERTGIRVWLDVAVILPGRAWQPELERSIPKIRTAAVFIGPAGLGLWQEREVHGYLEDLVSRGAPIIPVLLPGIPAGIPPIPSFLRDMVRVDFRVTDPDPLQELIRGITGKTTGQMNA